jgi:CubicO group peptidase (beta-lactamase class C family)
MSTPIFPSHTETDPRALGWMHGFPPPAERTVRFADGTYYDFPQRRWSFSHMRELLPTARVSRGDGHVCALPRADRDDLDAVVFTTLDGHASSWGEAFAANYTDGVAVLHRGSIVYEKYFGALRPDLVHSAFSVTKSFVGTLAAMQVYDRSLDVNAPVTHYVPELADSAYADATVRQVMDMTTGVRYSEAYADPTADIHAYARAGGMRARARDYAGPETFYDYLVTLKKEGGHGAGFTYKTVNSEVLAWIVKRVSGLSLADLTSTQIWSKLGCEYDALYQVDSVGTEAGGGGLNTTLRDLARFGETMRCDGRFNGQQIIPSAVVADIRNGASREQFATAGYATLPGWSYRNMWWVSHDDHQCFTARGIHGQAIWVDPTADMVIARYASHPLAANVFMDPTSLPAYRALGDHLMRG